MSNKKILTRFASLKGWNGLILGRDLNKIFEPGKVYGVQKIAGEILIKELGNHALVKHYEGNRVGYYVTNAAHLLTEEEYKIQLDAEKNL